MNLHTRYFLRMIRKDWEIYSLQFITLSLAFATSIIVVGFSVYDRSEGREFYDSVKYGEPYCILILNCISGLIMLLAITNFVNLVSLTLPIRSKELAIRKVAGANRPPLIGLLAKENFVVTGISSLIAIGLLVAGYDYFSQWLKFSVTAAVVLCILFLVVALAPLIPAWAFVKASPGRLLSTDTITFPRMKNVITFIQLGVSISLIIASLVIDRQISRSLIREPGKNHEQIVYVKWPRDLSLDYFNRMKSEWPRDNPHIVKVIGVSHTPDNLTSRNIEDNTFKMHVDYDFKDFFEVDMIKGRWFGPNDGDKMIVNTNGDSASIAVIGNFFTQHGLHELPVKLTVGTTDFNFVMIRILEVDIRNTIDVIERDLGPVTILNKNYAKTITYEDQLNQLSSLLAIVSLAMACCAIYALSLSRMNDNIKQIAIRKTFGATNGQIVGSLSIRFLELMLASIFLFGPVTFILLREWLRNFAYSAKFSWSDPLISIAICLIIVLVTNMSMLVRINTSALKDLLRR